jgi:hypothetical protein
VVLEGTAAFLLVLGAFGGEKKLSTRQTFFVLAQDQVRALPRGLVLSLKRKYQRNFNPAFPPHFVR